MADPAAILAALIAAQAAPAATLPSAVRACLDATSVAGVDDARLRASGWEAYDIEVGDEDPPLRIYGSGRGPMLLAGTGADSRESGCHVIEPLSARTSFATAATALETELRIAPADRKAAEAIWVVGDKGVMLEAITRNAKPAVQVTVVTIAEGTK